MYYRKFFAAVIFAATFCPLSSFASIVPTGQSRFVSASANAQVSGESDADSGAQSAPLFAPFSGLVQPLAVASVSGNLVPPASAIAQASAQQNSVIGTSTISASGEAAASITLTPSATGSGSGSGTSFFDLFFELTSAADFQLTGQLDTQAIVTGGALLPQLSNSLSLEDFSNSTLLFENLTADEAFAVSGSLQPGIYRLFAEARVVASQESSVSGARTVNGISSFEFDFTISDSSQVPDSGHGLLLVAALVLSGFSVWFRRSEPSFL